MPPQILLAETSDWQGAFILRCCCRGSLLHVGLFPMHCAIVNVCCWRDPEETLLRLPAPLSFCMLLHVPPGNYVPHSEMIDVLAWAPSPSPSDLMGLVYALTSLALLVFHCCVAEVHAMPRSDLMVVLCALALSTPSEVLNSVVVCCGAGVAVRVSLALVLAPLEVPCSIAVVQCSPLLFSSGIVGAC